MDMSRAEERRTRERKKAEKVSLRGEAIIEDGGDGEKGLLYGFL